MSDLQPKRHPPIQGVPQVSILGPPLKGHFLRGIMRFRDAVCQCPSNVQRKHIYNIIRDDIMKGQGLCYGNRPEGTFLWLMYYINI